MARTFACLGISSEEDILPKSFILRVSHYQDFRPNSFCLDISSEEDIPRLSFWEHFTARTFLLAVTAQGTSLTLMPLYVPLWPTQLSYGSNRQPRYCSQSVRSSQYCRKVRSQGFNAFHLTLLHHDTLQILQSLHCKVIIQTKTAQTTL